jgi:Mg-chelatase subunit ChlD
MYNGDDTHPLHIVSSAKLQKGRSSRVVVPRASQKTLVDEEVQALRAQGYTKGLVQALARNSLIFPLRIWVVDNSGSMSAGDGHRIVATRDQKDVRFVTCSRWAEIQETVEYHAQMATLLATPTVFRLLNDPGSIIGPQQFSIGERGLENIDEDLRIARTTMQNTAPVGVTPLAEHVREIRSNVMALQQELVQKGQKVAIVLATDGLPTDPYGVSNSTVRAEFEHCLRSLEGLPVWLVIRLCTDEDNVTEYYNNLDSQLELSLEVLDDFSGEAKEVYEYNKWLNYALPIHRIREMGFHHRLFDLLDERKLTLDELREFLILLYGQDLFDGVPDHHFDWDGFLGRLSTIIYQEKNQWNPITKKMEPWINIKKLKKAYSEESCCIM